MKPIDISKFKKELSKMTNISVGHRDPKIWVNTGSYLLNYLISDDFLKGIPLGKVTVLAGESGSGKSYIASGNVIRHAQQQGIFVVLIDTERALDEKWLNALGVDTTPEKLLKINAAMINDVSLITSSFMEDYKQSYDSISDEERPKVLFVIDSLGMLLTDINVKQFREGDLKGDMGHKPKALKALVTNCVNMFGEYDIGMLATNHTYASQDMFNPDPKISGGSGFEYASSILIALQKFKLKMDEDGNKIKEVRGIRCQVKIMKSRYAKPFESGEINIPYDTGMDPYSGLIDLFESKNVLIKDGKKLKYISLDGIEYKHFRKNITNELLDLIMKEFPIVIENIEKDNLEKLKLTRMENENE